MFRTYAEQLAEDILFEGVEGVDTYADPCSRGFPFWAYRQSSGLFARLRVRFGTVWR